MKSRVNFKRWAYFLFVPILISSCLDQGDPVELPPVAHVSLYHASPNAPALDLYVEHTRINQQIVNYANSISYTRFRVGERHFRITPYNGFNTLHESSHTLEADKIYSIFITNSVSNMSTLMVEDKWSTPSSGNVGLRSLHLSPDLGAVRIKISREGKEYIQNGSFEQINDFEELEAGQYTIEVISDLTGQTLLSAENMELRNGRIYTLLIRGFQTPTEGSSNGLALQLLTNYNTL
ncbi:hypothetical protein EL17_20905 [Anditalea andensis]|uniref:DUF4397 domain-containing protein n=2 Tax=Anditalea andensis TaxID=1048983 RepID=A0A074KPU3_9BACT|nr:hypothetical protein EL17_20905 [Anditalea andensis]